MFVVAYTFKFEDALQAGVSFGVFSSNTQNVDVDEDNGRANVTIVKITDGISAWSCDY